MPGTLRSDVEYPPVIMSGSPAGYHILIFGGATQTGKSARADMLAARKEGDFVYGPKGKIRPDGVRKRGDNERPDSILLTENDYQNLKTQGHVLKGAEYVHGPTKYVPLMNYPQLGYSAVPEGHHVIYVSLTHEGAMKIREALTEFNPLPILLYTRLETLRKRLDASGMSEHEKVRRMQTYANDLAQFRFRTPNYLFLQHVKSPTIPDDLYSDASSRRRAQDEIQKDANGIVDLIARFGKVFRPPMTYQQVHQAFVENKVKSLFGANLDNLDRKLEAGAEVNLDVKKEMKAYLDAGNFLSDAQQTQLNTVHPLGLVNANGRYTLLLRGLENPWQRNNGHRPLEDILLEFIIAKLGEEPTVKEAIKEQTPGIESNLGLVKAVEGVLLKDGLTYSLGNTHLVDEVHPSLSLVFVYPQRNDMDLRRAVVGMDSLEVQNLENRTIQ